MLYYKNIFAALAQLVEHVICNLGVVGPSPTGSLQKGWYLTNLRGDGGIGRHASLRC